MKLYQRIIAGGLVLAGLTGMLGCDDKPAPPTANTSNKTSIMTISAGSYGGRAIAAADFDGDGIADLLSTKSGDVYFHKGLGNLKFQE